MSVTNLFRRLMTIALRTRKTAPIRKTSSGLGRRIEELEDRTTPAYAYPDYIIDNAGSSPAGSPTPPGSAFTPAELDQAYGVNQIMDGGLQQQGAGQTVAIIDAYDNPMFVSSNSAGFLTSDLHKFDVEFNLPEPAGFFTKVNQTGGTSYPAGNTGWGTEIALDVEWVHSIAPLANIILVEANDNSDNNLLGAAHWAATNTAATVVTMSFSSPGGFSGESSYDSDFVSPPGKGVTFFASTGDYSVPAGYPAESTNVVAVGGTTLTVSGGNYSSEKVWGDGHAGDEGGSGGISQYESAPPYQNGLVIHSGSSIVNQNGYRATPDVAFDADPNSGVAVLDSYSQGSADPWIQVGGTSLSSPSWAGLMSITDEIRANHGLGSLNGATQTLPTLYNIYYNPAEYAADFHDVTTGSNGYSAAVGYDLGTGIGTPIANMLVPALALGTPAGLTATLAGGNLTVTDTLGNADNVTATVSGTNYVITDTLQAFLPTVVPAGTTLSNNNQTLTVPESLAGFTGNLQFNLAGGNNTLIVNDSGGNFANPITYNGGGSGTLDGLVVQGSGTQSATYTPSGTTDGSGAITSSAGNITFSNLTPVDITGMATATMTFPNANDVVNVANGTDYLSGGTHTALDLTGTSGGVAFESAAFWNDTNLVINTTSVPGTDAVTIASANNANGITNFTVTEPTNQSGTIAVNGAMTFTGAVSLTAANGNSTAAGTINTGTGLTVNISGAASNLAGAIGGAGGVTMQGTGTLTLSSNTNSYTGATTVTSGTLADGIANALPTGTALTVTSPGLFDLAGFNQQVGSVTGTGTVTDSGGAATFTVNDSTSDTFAGTLTGTNLALTQAGTSTLTLTAINTYSGQTTITNGTLALDQAGTNNSTLGFGNILVNAGGTLLEDLANQIYDPSTLTLNGGTWNIGSATSPPSREYIGGLTMSNNAQVIGTGWFIVNGTSPGNITTTGSGNAGTISANITLASSNGVNQGNRTQTFNVASGTTLTVSGVIADTREGTPYTGSLALTGGGTLTLTAANTYSGTTTISGGALVDGITNALPTGTALTVTSPGIFNLSGFNQQVASVTGSGIVTDSGTAATFTVNNATADSYAGTITGANLSLTKTGAGTLTLTSANTYGGSTSVSGGTLADGIANALPTGTGLTVTSPGTFDLAGFNQQVGNLNGTGIVTSSASGSTMTVTGTGTLSGTMTGASNLALTINGGTLTLGGGSGDTSANTYTGTTLIENGGTLNLNKASGTNAIAGNVTIGNAISTNSLVLDNNSQIAATSVLSFNSGGAGNSGKLDLNGYNQTVAGIQTLSADGSASVIQNVDNGTPAGPNSPAVLTVNDAASYLYDGLIRNNNSGSSTLALVKQGAGTLTLADGYIATATNYTGTTTISGGTLELSNLGGFNSAITDTAALIVNQTTNNLTLSTGISGSGGTLTKIGTGTLTLTGTNSYTGATTVSAGTLLVNANDSAATGAVAVNSTGTLGGTGTIGGAVTVNTGGFITGGTVGTVGTLTVASLTLTGTYQADFNGNSSDTITTAGTVNLTGGTFTVSSQTGTTSPANVYTLIQNTGSAAISGTPLTGATEGGMVTINGVTTYASYEGGNGKSFTLTASGSPSLNFNGTLTVRKDATGGVSNIQLIQGTTVVDERPLASIPAGGTYTVNSNGGSTDSLTVDYTNGSTAPAGLFTTNISFNETGAPASLSVKSGNFGKIAYNPSSATAETIQEFINASDTTPITISATGVSTVSDTSTYAASTQVGSTSFLGTGTPGAASAASLINGLTPITNTNTQGGAESTGGVGVLTDGLNPTPFPGGTTSVYTIGNNATLTYALNTASHPLGYDIDNINVIAEWRDTGRSQISISNISYSTVAAPSTFIPISGTAAVYQNGIYDEVLFSAAIGAMATGVADIQFNFGTQQNSYVGYGELDVIGAPTATPGVGIVNLPNLPSGNTTFGTAGAVTQFAGNISPTTAFGDPTNNLAINLGAAGSLTLGKMDAGFNPSSGVQVTGSSGNDSFTVNWIASQPITINGNGGSDSVTVNSGKSGGAPGSTGVGEVVLTGSSTYTATVTGVGNDIIDVNDQNQAATSPPPAPSGAPVNGTPAITTGSGTAAVATNGVDVLNYSAANLTTLNLVEATGTNTYNIQFVSPTVAGSKLPTTATNIQTSTKTDTANLFGSPYVNAANPGIDTFDVGYTTAGTTTDGGKSVTYPQGGAAYLKTLNVYGEDEPNTVGNVPAVGDTFKVFPDAYTAVNIEGGLPDDGYGNTLILNAFGLTNPVITPLFGTIALPNGEITSSNKATVTWNSIETFPVPLGLGGTFDFQPSTSATQQGFLPVYPTTTPGSAGPIGSAQDGWLNPGAGAYDRQATYGASGVPNSPGLATLLETAEWGDDGGVANGGQFQVTVAPNQIVQVSAYIGDTFGSGRDLINVYVGTPGNPYESLLNPSSSTFNTFASTSYKYVSYSGMFNPGSSSTLVFTIDKPYGGTSAFWTISGLDVRPVGLIAPLTLARADSAPFTQPQVADGLTVDTYNGSGAAPFAELTINPQYGTPYGTDIDPAVKGFQVQANAAGDFTFQILRETGSGPSLITVTDVTGASGTGQVGPTAAGGLAVSSTPYLLPNPVYQTYTLPVIRRIDFGPLGTPDASDSGPAYLEFDNSPYVSTAANALGWIGTAPTTFDNGSSYNNLQRDGVYGTSSTPGDFELDMPAANTVYSVTVLLGDPVSVESGMYVEVVDPATGTIIQSTPVTGANTAAGQSTSFTFPVTSDSSGRIRLRFGVTTAPSNGFWTLQDVEVRPEVGTASPPVGTEADLTLNGTTYTGTASGTGGSYTATLLPGTITANGTTSTTYTISGATPNSLITVTTSLGTLTTPDAGPTYTGVQVLASNSGMATFTITTPLSTASQTSTITVTEVTGASLGVFTQNYSAYTPPPPPSSPPTAVVQRLDFTYNGSPVQAGFTSVPNTTVYSPTIGYGWSTVENGYDRGVGSVPAPYPANLYRAGAWGEGSGTFEVSVPIGSTDDVRVYVGDPYNAWAGITVSVDGSTPVAVDPVVDRFGYVTVTGVADTHDTGVVDITINGGIWVVSGVDVATTGGLPTPATGASNPIPATGTRLEFASTAISGFTSVSNTTVFTPGAQYGWSSPVSSFVRPASYFPAGSPLTPTEMQFYGSAAYGSGTSTFEVAVQPGATYSIRAYVSDPYNAWTGITISAEGGTTVSATATSNPPGMYTLTGQDVNGDGILSITISGPIWVLNGLDIVQSPNSLPAAP